MTPNPSTLPEVRAPRGALPPVAPAAFLRVASPSRMDAQAQASAQKLFMAPGFMAEMPEPIDLPMEWIAQCKSDADAIRLCINCRRDKTMTMESLADHIGMNPGNFSRAIKYGALTSERRLRLMYVCGNRAPSQYENWKLGQVVVRDSEKERRIRELQNELQQLQGVA